MLLRRSNDRAPATSYQLTTVIILFAMSNHNQLDDAANICVATWVCASLRLLANIVE